MRVKWITLLSVAVTFVLLGLVIYRGRDVWLGYEWRVDWYAIVAAFAAMILTFAIVASVWVAQMRAVGSALPASIHINYYVVSHLIRRLPGTIWYIAGRSYLYRQQGESGRLIAVVSSLEMILLTIGATLVVLMLWGTGFQQLPGGYLPVFAAVVLIGALLVQPSSSRWLIRRFGKVSSPSLSYGQLVAWLTLYVAAWFASGMVFYLLAYAFTGLGREHLPYAIGVWAFVGALSTFVFFLPSNFGITEIGITLLMSTVMPASVAAVLALLVRISMTVFDLLAVGIWFGAIALWRAVFREP